jgi:TonB dependent receptor
MAGALGGLAVKPDGSNINPVALELLNFKLPNGSFLIPSPQSVDALRPFAQQGFSVFTQPCQFAENQFLGNIDYLVSAKSRFAARFFLSNDSDTVTLPGNGLNPSGNILGFPSPSNSGFRVFSVSNTYALSSNWLNAVRAGYVRTKTHTRAITPFKWSDVGVAEGEMSENNELPSLNILGSVSIASGFPRSITQNSFVFDDVLSFVRGAQTVRLGGSLTRYQDNVNLVGLGSFVQFLSWPDFLLGLNAATNSTTFSNVFGSFDAFGLTDREYRAWEGSGFVQDDYKISRSLTLNVGLRYERFGQLADQLGRSSSFDFSKADPNPPPGGSLAGYIVASNFSGVLPAGVMRVGDKFGTYGDGQNTIAPRIGFAWQFLHRRTPLVLRGGYGVFYSRTTGQAFYQSIFGAPFSEFRLIAGTANANATFQAPFAQPFPTPDSYPLFPAHAPTTDTSIYSIAPNFRPASIQQYSLNVQTELVPGWLLEVGYVGTRGTHLVRQRSLNQALAASEKNPIRNVTTNTVANIPERVPIPGVPADSLQIMESEGSSWYSGLEVSLTKRISHGLQFLASYTFSKTLDTDGSDINSTSAGTALTLGDQNSSIQRWGRASFDRTHRFVFGETWTLPSPARGVPHAVLGGWDLASVVTIQSGSALTIANTNANNVFGISEDRAQLSGTCSTGQLVNGGSVQSKLNRYFNLSCFTTPPVIGTDGIGTAFGDSATGIVSGPGQANIDFAISKTVSVHWPVESSSIQLRAEFFNALNHPQFSNPDTNFASPTFGVINSTSVNARVGQLAIRFSF